MASVIQSEPSGLLRVPTRHRERPISMTDYTLARFDGLQQRQRCQDDIFAMSKDFIVDIPSALQYLFEEEDTDKDGHITVADDGPKSIFLGTQSSNGYHKFPVLGTYAISNLFQDLAAARDEGHRILELQSSQLHKDPVTRLTDLINNRFWSHLTRRLDEEVLANALKDSKNTGIEGYVRRLYVPENCDEQVDHYTSMAERNPELNLVVKKLSLPLDRAAYRKLSDEPGLLALDMDREIDATTGEVTLSAVPFVVPGGWFNEFFGWDSYFIGLGLILAGKTDLVKSIVRNWIFEIQHYGLIPNANRSYFILRSQPPFLTDLCLRLYNATSQTDTDARESLKKGIQAAVKEYHSVWMKEPYLDKETGLSRYRPRGYGIPPEVDLEFFRPVLEPYAEKHGLSVEDLAQRFTDGTLDDPELEDYFLHDRALRESGHDTQNRLEGRTADLAIIDLNCLLYKFETDIAHAIDDVFAGDFDISQEFLVNTMTPDDCKAETWRARAAKRKTAMDKYLWNAERGIFVDYNSKTKTQEPADSPTCLWALWSGLASPTQAASLVTNAIPLFECKGGLASSSKATGYMYTRRSYQSQWDYPHGWAPHQMLAWDGLVRYGYEDEAARLAYRWLGTILNVFVHYNGAVVEKYDVTKGREAHQVDTEYPNQGFSYQAYVKEGFGWTNASFVYGLQFLNERQRRALALLAPWEAAASIKGEPKLWL